MTATTRLALLVFGLGLILGSALASEYAFGSKVYPGDRDVGLPLTLVGPNFVPLSAPLVQTPVQIGFWDIGTTFGAYDDGDVVYLHFGLPVLPAPGAFALGAEVRANDIRFTPFSDKIAGSKVTAIDNDIGTPLNIFPPGPGPRLIWLNFYGGPGFDLKDPVIVHAGPIIAPTALNDIRLTESEGLPAGTKIQNSDPDFGILPAGPVNPTNPIAPVFYNPSILYFDVNGNSVYDYLDDVYLRFPSIPPNPAIPPSTVKVNDVRISGPVY